MNEIQDPIIPIVTSWIADTPGTISLGQGVVHYPPPAEVSQGIERFLANPQNHKYQPGQGIPELRAQIERKLREENGISLDQGYSLFVTAGGNQAFVNAISAISDPGDEIILMTPYYFNFEMAIGLADCRAVLVPMNDQFQLDMQRIADAITPRTKAIVTISPNNPTGSIYPESDLRSLNELCSTHGLYHIADEVYEYFTYGDALHFSPASISGASEHTITIQSLSKAYGFASWRIGYMLVPKHLEYSVVKAQDTIVVCPPVISQWAAASALEVGAEYCRSKIRQFSVVRDQVLQQLESISSLCRVPNPEGAFYVFADIRSELEPLELVRRLIEEHQVAVIPGSAFGMTEGCFLRLSYGALLEETVVEGVRRFVDGVVAIVEK